MARADLLLSLVRSGSRGDKVEFRKIVEALAAEERAKKHTILADRLLAQIQLDSYRSIAPPNSNAGPLVIERVPERGLEDMILPSGVEATVREVVEEQHRADLLRSYNVEPRSRIMLVGPPGNGKTTLAEAIAKALSVPLVVVRYEAVIASYLGETAQRISQVFEHARSRHCVLFFDEFDSVGKERGDLHETGEIKRVVSSLLLQIDVLPSYVVVITASNHPELLDRAVWRRFQVRLELSPPTQVQIEDWFKRFEKRTKHSLGLPKRSLAQKLYGLSYGEVEDFGTDVLRGIILNQPDTDIRKITERCLNEWQKRFTLKESNYTEASK